MSVEEIIEKSFNDLIKAITTDGSASQLIFPHSNKGDVRHSEQELRQIFLRNVEEDSDKTYFYSIETPTKLVYRFTNTEIPKVKDPDDTDDNDKDNYKSARFDVSLYNKDYKDNDKASNHIELKSDNPEEEDICKDFLKLAKEVKFTKEKKNFFVHYHCVEETSWKSDTFSSLFEKYRKSVDKIENKIEDKNDLSNVELYLVCIHRKNKSPSTYHFSLADLKNYKVGTKYSDITDKLWLNEEIFNLGEEIHFKESKK